MDTLYLLLSLDIMVIYLSLKTEWMETFRFTIIKYLFSHLYFFFNTKIGVKLTSKTELPEQV